MTIIKCKDEVGVAMLELQSSQSMRVSLESIRRGDGGLDAHRTSILNRVPAPGDWARFEHEFLTMKDLAYLTAKTGHEFAILRGKREDILYHGEVRRCEFTGLLFDMLIDKRLCIYGHSHPGEETPTPSPQDRKTLEMIGQSQSRLISGLTGLEITYTADPFQIL